MSTGSALPEGPGAMSGGPTGVRGTAVPRNGVVAGVTLGETAADGVAVVAVTVAVIVSVAVAVPGVGDGACAWTLLMLAISATVPDTSTAAATIKDACRTSRMLSLLLLGRLRAIQQRKRTVRELGRGRRYSPVVLTTVQTYLRNADANAINDPRCSKRSDAGLADPTRWSVSVAAVAAGM
jgi:hypothetical protein